MRLFIVLMLSVHFFATAALAESIEKVKVLMGHEEDQTAIAFSGDGSFMATGSADKTVIIWDAKTFRQLKRLTGHGETVWATAFSPDAKTLYTGDSDKRVIAWDVATGVQKLKFKAYGDVRNISVSPDGLSIAVAADDKVLAIFNKEGERVKKLKGHKDDVRCVTFSPDGTKVASGSHDNSVIIWDLATGKVLSTLRGHTNNVTRVAFTPDGKKIISADQDNLVLVWDASSGEQLHILNDHGGSVRGITFAGGKMISVDSRTSVTFAFGIPVKQDSGSSCKLIVWDMSKWKAESKVDSDCEANDLASNGTFIGVAAKSTSIFKAQ